MSSFSSNTGQAQKAAALEIENPSYPLNFLATRLPERIILSERVAGVIPELSGTPVENFYWVLGQYAGRDFIALDRCFASYGGPTAVSVSVHDFLGFNRDLEKLSTKLTNFAIVPIHNHPNVLQYAADVGPCIPARFSAEVDRYLTELLDKLSEYKELKLDPAAFDLRTFKRLLFSNRYDPKSTLASEARIIKQASELVKEAALMLSEEDCALGAAFHLLCPFSETVTGKHRGVIARTVECDWSDQGFPMFSALYRLIPITAEAPAKLLPLISRSQSLITRAFEEQAPSGVFGETKTDWSLELKLPLALSALDHI